MTLTSKQRAFLNSQAHSLKPIIQIGKNGLNDQMGIVDRIEISTQNTNLFAFLVFDLWL